MKQKPYFLFWVKKMKNIRIRTHRLPKILEKNLVLNGWGELHGPAIKAASTRASAPWLRDLCMQHCGGDHFFCFLSFDYFYISKNFKYVYWFSFFVFMCFGGTTLEDTSVCQLTEDLLEFYNILYAGPRFLSQQELDRPLFLLSLSVSPFVWTKKWKQHTYKK